MLMGLAVSELLSYKSMFTDTHTHGHRYHVWAYKPIVTWAKNCFNDFELLITIIFKLHGPLYSKLWNKTKVWKSSR